MANVKTAIGAFHDIGVEHKTPFDYAQDWPLDALTTFVCSGHSPRFSHCQTACIRRAFNIVEWPAMSKRSASNGAEEIRTPDPHVANVVLYQLSYRPM